MPNRESFRREVDLLPVLLSSRGALVPTQPGRRIQVFEHVQVGTIIPDLVLVASRANHTERNHLPRLTVFDAWVATVLQFGGPKAALDIAGMLHGRASRVRTSLARLKRHRLVTQASSEGVFKSNAQRIRRRAEIVAVEAKLERWSEAIQQARHYLTFANRAYIAIPAHRAKASNKVRQECRKAGVGLVAVGKREASVLVRAPRAEVFTPERLWLLWRTLGT